MLRSRVCAGRRWTSPEEGRNPSAHQDTSEKPTYSYASRLDPPLPAVGRTIRTWITSSPLVRYMTKLLIAPPAPGLGSLRRGNLSFTTQEKEVTTWCPSRDSCHALLLLGFCWINCWQRSRRRIDRRTGGRQSLRSEVRRKVRSCHSRRSCPLSCNNNLTVLNFLTVLETLGTEYIFFRRKKKKNDPLPSKTW